MLFGLGRVIFVLFVGSNLVNSSELRTESLDQSLLYYFDNMLITYKGDLFTSSPSSSPTGSPTYSPETVESTESPLPIERGIPEISSASRRFHTWW